MKAIVLGAIAVLAAACAPGDREVRLRRLALQRQGLVQQLDGLQARLLVDRERVRFWAELRERRDSVTALTCGGDDEADLAREDSRVPGAAARRPHRAGRTARLAAFSGTGSLPDPTP